mgnify:CR=1 FL=1
MLNIHLFLGNLGGPEILLIAFVVLLLFGGKKLPELMRGLGKGIKEFNNAKANIESEVKESMKEIDGRTATPQAKMEKQELWGKKTND